MRRVRLLGTGLAVLLALAGCTGAGAAHQAAAHAGGAATLGPATRLADLQHPGHTQSLFGLFNRDRGSPRLVLLISPT